MHGDRLPKAGYLWSTLVQASAPRLYKQALAARALAGNYFTEDVSCMSLVEWPFSLHLLSGKATEVLSLALLFFFLWPNRHLEVLTLIIRVKGLCSLTFPVPSPYLPPPITVSPA